MRIGLVVDAVCDLPDGAKEEFNIEVMPVEVHIGGLHFYDDKNPKTTASFYRERLMGRGMGRTEPISVDEIRRVFLERLVLQYDFVFFLTTSSARSAIYNNALQASLAIVAQHKAIRAAAGIRGPFAMRVIDTQVIVGAQAVSALEAARMIREGASPNEIEARLNELIPKVYGYIVANDLAHLRKMSLQSNDGGGEAAIGWLPYVVARALNLKPVMITTGNHIGPVATIRHFENANSRLFEFGIRRIRAGLSLPLLGVGYSGPLAALQLIPGYEELRREAHSAGVHLVTLQMGVIAGLYLGADVVGMAFASDPHKFE